MLKATAKQHGFRLTGELVSCSARSRAKGHRAPTPHHATRRATQPLGLVHINTAGPYPTYLRGSWYVVMSVDSASRLQRPYGVREKSAAAVLSIVKRFVADMGVPRVFSTDNGTEYPNSMFLDFCNGLGIRREFTAPYTPQQYGPVESAISRAFKAGHAAQLRVPQLYPCIARCVMGIRPSSWYTIGPCGYGVNAGERRSNQRDCSPTWRRQRLAGPADRACIGPTYTQQYARRGEVASCRHMATLHAPGIQWSFTGRYLRAGAGLAISRERDRCYVGVHVESR